MQYGKTWWGKQWLNSLNNIDYSNRLPRGSSYANKGAVEKISINENIIRAKVKGTRPKPYNVDIILPPFFNPELGEFLKNIASRPVIISKMLNRELDPSVLTIAEDLGLKVFPKQWTDFKMQCSCPDWAVPCKHLAAVIYKLSAEIDNNPFLVFSLHKVDLIAELNKLGILVKKETTEIPKLTDLYFKKPLNEQADFNVENAYQKLIFSKLSPLNQPLAALLSDYPAFYPYNNNFKDKYVHKVNRTVKNTEKVIKGKIKLENLFYKAKIQEQAINYRSTQQIILNEEHRTKVIINNKEFSVIDFLWQLSKIDISRTYDYQPSTASMHSVMYLALHLLANGAVIPQIIQQPNNKYNIRWLPAVLSKDVRLLVEKLDTIVPPNIFLWDSGKTYKEINNNTALNLLSLFITEIINILYENEGVDIFTQLFFSRFSYDFKAPGEEALCGGIQSWIQKYYITQGKFKPIINVSELANDNFLISINIDDGVETPILLEDILTKNDYDNIRYEILQSLTQLSSFIPGLDTFINSNGKKPIMLDSNEFTPFLMSMIPAIQLLDISIFLPKSLQDILKPRASIKIKSKTEKGKAFITLSHLFDFDWKVALGDNLIDAEEFKKLTSKSEGLIRYKSNYIYVEKEELEKLYKYFNSPEKLDAFTIFRAALSGEFMGAPIQMSDEIKKIIEELTSLEDINLPKDIDAELRPYQKRGYSWLYRNSKIGFGSVLADDMGLGKTLQVIVTLQKYKEEGLLKDKKAIVVAPTGLLSNWESEIKKFAPKLKSKIYHGTHRRFENSEEYDVLITSYGVVRSDAKELKKMEWQSLIIDEAQNIKNINTAQTKAIKLIPAENFIAMSGTPVENRLSELWSIFDYSNRGFLGSIKEFNENYGTPIQQYNDVEVANRLKKVTAPFLMRRLKTDKTIISDLPDKIEMDCFAILTKEQAILYDKILEKAMKDIEGIQATDQKTLFIRQGLVLQMILALKQICNHPTQYLKNNILDCNLSGKIELLFDKLDSIIDTGEKVLLFTQFTEMGKLLKHFITERYNDEPLFYHGGCNIKQRNKMVADFQTNRADKIFILSLKAAGTGLNLTAANHVIHYDLWWNPAVETQATDRAYRIGQKNNVLVHRFITKNTFEERINEMIQSKKNLAEMTVATGENWIGNLSNKELRDIFQMNM